jgi:ATP-binding cassette, subfamily B, bacterial MsbA
MNDSDSTLKIYKRLLTYVVPFKWAFIAGILGNVLYGIVDASFMKLLEPLMNRGFVAHDMAFIAWIPYLVIGFVIVRGIASFLSTYFMGWVGRRVVMTIRQDLFSHMLSLPASFYDNNTSGELLSKITYNVEQVADASTDALTVLVRETCTVIGLIIVMLTVSWHLTLLFFVVMPIMAVVMHFVSKRLRFVSNRVQQSVGGVAHVAEEALEGHKVIKAFGGQHYEREQFCKVTRSNLQQEMKLIVTSALSVPAIQLIGSFALAAMIYLATLPPEAGDVGITPGGFTTLIGAMFMLLKPLKQLTKVNGNIQKGIANAASVFALLELPAEQDNGTHSLERVTGRIEFKDVSFSYDESKHVTLSNITFKVEPGETIAIVGRSGGGKSTLVNLIPRFYDAKGLITLDGVDVHNIPLKNLRKQFAFVSQNVTLFNETIARNIAYGQDEFNLDAVIAAAKKAHAWEFISQLPEGMDTVIGENGVRLSGGQRQRIAIARAIMKQAPILILDEATSALDTESERKIQDALEELMSHCTTLVIAHRLSTIENADRILVIDSGQVIEMGTHEELILQKGIYAELRVMQYHSTDRKAS